MGDTNVPQSSLHSGLQGNALPQSGTPSGGSGMEALMSAIEYRRGGMVVDPKLGGIGPKLMDGTNRGMLYSGYNMMAAMQDPKGPGGLVEKHRATQEQSTQPPILFSTHLPFAAPGVTPAASPAPFLGFNPMMMPFLSPVLPGLRPTVSNQPQRNMSREALPQPAGVPHWGVRSTAERPDERETKESLQMFKCSLCGAICMNADDLNTHLVQMHINAVAPHRGQEIDPRLTNKSSLPGVSMMMGKRLDGQPVNRDSPHKLVKTDASQPSKSSGGYLPTHPYVPQTNMEKSTNKITGLQEAVSKNMGYPPPSALHPYIGLQNFLAANASGLLPSILPATYNPTLGALGYQYYQNSLLSRLPYLPQVGQNSLLQMPLGANVSTPPAPSLTPDVPASNKANPLVGLDPSRPQSGGYLPVKENLQRRLSAPVMVSGSPTRMPLRAETLLGKPTYTNYPHRVPLPTQLIAPTPDPAKPSKPHGPGKGRIDHKSIEQHISKLISHNEKILLNPTLDRVKPRRVFRRNSLDPSSLSSTPPHNPLTTAYSAPRSLDPEYHNPLLDDKPSSDRHNFLTVPSRLTEASLPNPDHVPGDKPFVTVIPDPRRHPDARRLADAMLDRSFRGKNYDESPSIDCVNQKAKAVTQGLYQKAAIGKALEKRMSSGSGYEETFKQDVATFKCADCGVTFTKQENYDTHRKVYCLKRNPESAAGGSIIRQSVIQHTGVQPGDSSDPSSLPKSNIPHVSITAPVETMHSSSGLNKYKRIFLPEEHTDVLMNPLRYLHKDLHRARSADAAFQISSHAKADEVTPAVSSPKSDKASPRLPSSPQKMDVVESTTHLAVTSAPTVTKSSIPTDKLPPKKKQLQLMRSNSSSQSCVESNTSPSRSTSIPNASTPNASPMSQGSKTPETSPVTPEAPYAVSQASPAPAITVSPPTSLPLSSAALRKSLPPWIPLDQDEESLSKSAKLGTPPVLLAPAPTIYLPQDNAAHTAGTVPQSPQNPSKAVTPTPRSPTSPRSPRSPRRLSPARSPTRSPSRSPTSNLESTIPRSNYKLLLHQISLRNMQDMGYLSEAYHNSKDKNLKRNIASLLWSSSGSPGSDGVGSFSKRSRQFSPDRGGPKMDELYPGKASLARRLSPAADSRLPSKYECSSSSRMPLSQSRSKPYENTLDPYHTSVTRSHSASYSSDVNNNIKQFLQNKNRNQMSGSSESSSMSSKAHKPLRRLNANARYVLKSPTRQSTPSPVDPNMSRMGARDIQDWKTSATRTLSTSWDSPGKTKESSSLKRASSCNPDPSMEYQNKRRKLIPIPRQTTPSSVATALQASLISSRITENTTIPKGKKSGETRQADPGITVQVSSLLYPHLTPKLGFEPHPTFCSLLSPQPMHVALEKSTLSMYSQWAVSEPLLLPDGLTVIDLFKNMKVLKGLSPYISYGSLFISAPQKGDSLNVTDTKKYDSSSKSKEKKSVNSDEATENKDAAAVPEQTEIMLQASDTKEIQEWTWSRTVQSRMLSSKMCYTSCHSKNLLKMTDKKSSGTALQIPVKKPEESPENQKNFTPKVPPPKVVIHPPSPVNSEENSRDSTPTPDSKNHDIAALEFSDCDADDTITEQLSPNHFLPCEKGELLLSRPTPSSRIPRCHTAPPKHVCQPPTIPPPLPNLPKTTPGDGSAPATQMDTDPHACKNAKNVTVKNEPKILDGKNLVENVELLRAEKELCPNMKIVKENPDSTPQSSSEDDLEQTDAVQNENGNSLEEGVKGQSSGSDMDEPSRKKNKKVRKSRRERNALSPRLQRKMNQQLPDSPPAHALEDPSLAVHPTGACRGLSDDPSRTCALCSMKAEGSTSGKCGTDARSVGCASDDSESRSEPATTGTDPNTAEIPEDKTCKHEPSALQDRATASPRPKTPTSARPRTPVPLTVSVPIRNRDRSSTKATKQPLAPGILDKARGKGTTQHWVTTTELTTAQSSPSPDHPKSEEKGNDSQENCAETKKEKTPPKAAVYDKVFQSSEYYSSMPPNKNPVLDLNLQKGGESPQMSPTVTTGGQHALAAVVSGVMRSAAIQSKKKSKSSKFGMNELLSHSRPLIPTSELNGTPTSGHARLPEKSKCEKEGGEESSSLGSLVAMTAVLGTPAGTPKQVKAGPRHLSLSTRESELFLNKTNETKTGATQPMKEQHANKINQVPEDTNTTGEDDPSAEKDCASPGILNADLRHGASSGLGSAEEIMQDDEGHSDDAKEDSMQDGDGESANPRPHKCLECKVAFRIAGHLAKHLRSKGHIIAMQKRTLNRLKQQQQKLSSASVQDAVSSGGQGDNGSGSTSNPIISAELAQQQALHSQLEAGKYTNQDELLNQLVEGAETLARAQVRALFEGNDEYTEIVTAGTTVDFAAEGGVSDVGEDGEEKFTPMSALSQQMGGPDPRPFKCIACKVAFRFQGHLDRHFRSNMHLLAVGHFERDKVTHFGAHPGDSLVDDDAVSSEDVPLEGGMSPLPSTQRATPDRVTSFDRDSCAQQQGNSSPMDTTIAENSVRSEQEISVANADKSGPISDTEVRSGSPELPGIDGPLPRQHTLDNNNNLSSTKELLNGISTHLAKSAPSLVCATDAIKTAVTLFPIGQEVSEAPPTSKDFKSIKQRLSPAIQSNTKPIFEAPPSLPDGPIPSSSPVHNRQQQLTC